MKKVYQTPMSEVVRMANGDDMMAFTDITAASNPGGPTSDGPVGAPARRITVLGSIGGGAGVGSLGSIGTVK